MTGAAMSPFDLLREIAAEPGDCVIQDSAEITRYGDIRETLIFDCPDSRAAFVNAMQELGAIHRDVDEALGADALDTDPADVLIVTPGAVAAIIAAIRSQVSAR